MDVYGIIKKYLKDNGYDGLCCEDCGCLIDSLVLCENDFSQCVPGYKREPVLGDPELNYTSWIVTPEK